MYARTAHEKETRAKPAAPGRSAPATHPLVTSSNDEITADKEAGIPASDVPYVTYDVITVNVTIKPARYNAERVPSFTAIIKEAERLRAACGFEGGLFADGVLILRVAQIITDEASWQKYNTQPNSPEP